MAESEGIGDIHNYLEHFNPKDVGGVVISKTEVIGKDNLWDGLGRLDEPPNRYHKINLIDKVNWKIILCTGIGAFLYACYSFSLFSNKICRFYL